MGAVTKGFLIYEEMRKYLVPPGFPYTYMRKIWFSILSVYRGVERQY
jgi:hypothetical protein